jgi:hypothetical protein
VFCSLIDLAARCVWSLALAPNLVRLIEVLLSRKFEELEPADFFVIMPLCPSERQQQIMAHLYHLRYASCRYAGQRARWEQ